jgi:transposase-like protein
MKDHVMTRRFVAVEALFNGRHFDRQIIILCVSWYTSFKLSFRDLVIIMAERSISLAHTTILRWVHYLPDSRSGGSVTLGRSADPGGWMKHR